MHNIADGTEESKEFLKKGCYPKPWVEIVKGLKCCGNV